MQHATERVERPGGSHGFRQVVQHVQVSNWAAKVNLVHTHGRPLIERPSKVNWGGPPLGCLSNPKIGHQTNRAVTSSCVSCGFLRSFFRPTPDGSRQVVYQAGKTIVL